MEIEEPQIRVEWDILFQSRGKYCQFHGFIVFGNHIESNQSEYMITDIFD